MLGTLLKRWRDERRRRRSARWLVRMHGPDAFRWREHFEAWRHADPENRRVYDRQLGLWGMASRLDSPGAPAQVEPRFIPFAIAASLAALVIGVTGVALWPKRPAPLQLVAADKPKLIRLADGSQVVLAGGSALDVRYSDDSRRLDLLRGRARVRMQAERRRGELRAGPVMLQTAGATVDLQLHDGAARVILLGGTLQLARYDGQPQDELPSISPGQLVEVGARPGSVSPRAAQASELVWPRAMVSFDDAMLSDVVEQANALSMTVLRIDGDELRTRRVTGAYQMGDSEGLARSLAASLGLSLTKTAEGALTLRKRD